jgi:hypothetical protein
MDELNFVHSFFLQSKEGATIIIYNFTQTFIWQLVYWAEIDYKIYDGGNCYFVSSIHWPIHYMSNCKKILNQYMNNPCYFVKIDCVFQQITQHFLEYFLTNTWYSDQSNGTCIPSVPYLLL